MKQKIIRRIKNLARNHPWLKRLALKILHRLPWLSQYVFGVAPAPIHLPIERGGLSPRAFCIYSALKESIEKGPR